MNFSKIKSSIAPFDEMFEGFYLGQPALLSGKRGSGTTTVALHFLSHLVRIGEKVLLFTDQPPSHVSFAAHGFGVDLTPALESEQLSIVPYDAKLPLLPFPEALEELRGLISDRHYSFVVFDPVIPWLAVPADHLAERLDAFFGLLADTSATALLILHHPVSKLARRLFDEVSDRCAVCITATRSHDGSNTLQVVKYMGEPPEKCPATLHLSTPAQASSTMPIHLDRSATQNINVVPPPRTFSASPSAAASFFPSRRAPAKPAQSARPANPAATAFQAHPPVSPGATASISRIPDGGNAFFSAPATPAQAPARAQAPTMAQAPARAPAQPPHPRTIHFADALDPAPRPQKAPSPFRPAPPAPPAPPPAPPPPPAPRRAPPPPADAQSSQGHSIRFSDIIQ